MPHRLSIFVVFTSPCVRVSLICAFVLVKSMISAGHMVYRAPNWQCADDDPRHSFVRLQTHYLLTCAPFFLAIIMMKALKQTICLGR